MRLTVLRMLSTSSLEAFSGATTTKPPGRADDIRLARSQPEPAARQAAPQLPNAAPAIPPPRGSYLNLSV